jgi:hypothetical protein
MGLRAARKGGAHCFHCEIRIRFVKNRPPAAVPVTSEVARDQDMGAGLALTFPRARGEERFVALIGLRRQRMRATPRECMAQELA